MLNVQLARKYSMAVFELAQDDGKLEEYGEQLAEVSRIVFGQNDLKSFVTNPQVQPKAKKELLSKLTNVILLFESKIGNTYKIENSVNF